MQSADSTAQVAHRLDSWKEIAAYFGKEVRTVRRWEAERDLPVHRLPGNGRGSVYAFEHELEAWLAGRRRTESEAEAPQELPAKSAPESSLAHRDSPAQPGTAAAPQESEPAVSAIPAMAQHSAWQRTSVWGLALLIVAAAGLGVLAAAHRRAQTRAQTGAAAAAPAPADTTARDLYLQGRYLWNMRTEASLSQAVDLFTQAVVRDPQYAGAYAGLADSYLLLREFGTMSDADAYERAYVAARRALALDDSSAEAHRSYAFILNYWMRNFPAAEIEFRRAIQLDPNDALTHHWYATSLLSVGRDRDALQQIDLARQLRPDSVAILADRGFILRHMDPAESLAALLEVERTNPDYIAVHRYLYFSRLDNKQFNDFLTEFREYYAMGHRKPELAVIDRARDGFASHGERAMFDVLARGFGRIADAPDSRDAMPAAFLFAQLQDRERTLHYLSLSCAREESDCEALRSMQEYWFLRGDKEYEALLTRSETPMKMPPMRDLSAR